MSKRRLTVLAVGGSCWLVAAHAQQTETETGPDLDFLEYLGAWAEDDDEWLAIEEWQKEGGEASGERAREAPEAGKNEDDQKSE
jgi:hypothetical protein